MSNPLPEPDYVQEIPPQFYKDDRTWRKWWGEAKMREYAAAEVAGARDCRSCRRAHTRDGYQYGCGSVLQCTDGNVYEPLPPVRLWRGEP